MNKLRHRIRKSVSALLSVLILGSAFSVSTALNASAVSYSEMSALDQYAYSGNDLGANYSKASTTFKVWAPTASTVVLNLYENGDGGEPFAALDMEKQDRGVWSAQADCGAGTYYTYTVTTSLGAQ